MGDIRFLVEVDATGAVKTVKNFDDVLDDLKKKSEGADTAHKSLWKQVALGQAAYDVAKKAGSLFVDFLKDSVDGAMESERAQKSLEAALIATGRPVESMARHLNDYSQERKKATIYDDDAITRAQALMVQLTNLDEKGLDAAMQGTIGLASVMGMDLDSAATVVGKSMAGNTALLSRYGIHVRETGTAEEKRADALEKLGGFYSRATAETETYGGKMAQLKNTYGDIQEAAGKMVTSNVAVMNSLNKIAEGIVYLANVDDMLAGKDAVLREQQNRQVEWLSKASVAAGWHYGAMSKLIEAYHGNTAALVVAINKGKEGTAIQEALNKVVKEAHGLWDSEAEARKKAEQGTNAGTEADEKAIEAQKKLRSEIQAIIDRANPWAAAYRKAREEIEKANKALKTGATDAKGQRMAIHSAELAYLDFMAPVNNGTAALLAFAMAGDNKVVPMLAGVAAASKKATFAISTNWAEAARTWLTKNEKTWQGILTCTSAAVNGMEAALSQSANNKMIILDQEYQGRLDSIKKGLLSEEEKNKAIEALDAEYDMKRRGLQRKAAQEGKAVAIAQATINVAQGVTAALRDMPPPFNAILAAITAAAGAVQIALIRATPIPLAQGAIFRQPAMLTSRGGNAYEVAEAGEAEILTSARKLRQALGLEGRGGSYAPARTIVEHHHHHLYIDGREIKQLVTKTVRKEGALGHLGQFGRALANG